MEPCGSDFAGAEPDSDLQSRRDKSLPSHKPSLLGEQSPRNPTGFGRVFNPPIRSQSRYAGSATTIRR